MVFEQWAMELLKIVDVLLGIRWQTIFWTNGDNNDLMSFRVPMSQWVKVTEQLWHQDNQ